MTDLDMRALSLSQPWLWAVLRAGKRVENRTWRPAARMLGRRIALHAAKSWDEPGREAMLVRGIDCPANGTLQRSAIVGVATVLAVVDHAGALNEDQRPWFFGPFGWLLADVVELPPIVMNGALGLWRIAPLAIERIHLQLAELGQ